MRLLTPEERLRLLGVTEEGEDYTSLRSPEEYHQLTFNYNWDAGVKVLSWIIERADCDLGTASKIFWQASPGYYAKYNNRDEVPEYNRDAFDLIRRILARLESGGFQNRKFRFDPTHDDFGDSKLRHFVDWTQEFDPNSALWPIPHELLVPTPGEPVSRQELIVVNIRSLNSEEVQERDSLLVHGHTVLRHYNPNLSDFSEPQVIVQEIEAAVHELRSGNPWQFGDAEITAFGWLWAHQLCREYDWEWKTRDAEIMVNVGVFAPEGVYASYPPQLIRYLVQVPSTPNQVVSLFKRLSHRENRTDFIEAFSCGWLSSV